jgi:hypothetical protein
MLCRGRNAENIFPGIDGRICVDPFLFPSFQPFPSLDSKKNNNESGTALADALKREIISVVS